MSCISRQHSQDWEWIRDHTRSHVLDLAGGSSSLMSLRRFIHLAPGCFHGSHLHLKTWLQIPSSASACSFLQSADLSRLFFFFYRVSHMLLQNFRASVTQWNRVSQITELCTCDRLNFCQLPVQSQAGQLKRQWSKTLSWSLDSVFGLLCGQGLCTKFNFCVDFISY